MALVAFAQDSDMPDRAISFLGFLAGAKVAAAKLTCKRTITCLASYLTSWGSTVEADIG